MAFHVLDWNICLPIKYSITVYPSTPLTTFSGLELDTVKFEIRLPEDKLVNLRFEVKNSFCKDQLH